ncbi:UDP-N-acetylmuramoyl-L-alanyl-D-glutamate--2,6-diaminopimelate ligase [Aliidiomarina celeris]|uniref:UDP-N-acetylmuramoyl-L-alanyl-D-glutamate--2, 6-diaminopimelate ligase n=1 Tax=Aliidiomarina celeris TaxID=2249428 RepID=UPI001E2CF940|nr:UDP-N-acetylmuramoyl-L-alanyl-D-glutamate--2,6-diaminopimelate ligase [Aliidiomarina celeris]
MSDLLSHLRLPEHAQLQALTVTGLKLDSRKVTPGDAFIAVPGYQTDGREYISAAIAAGARVVLSEGHKLAVQEHAGVPVLSIPNLRSQVSDIAGAFFDQPSRKLRLCGVTGTNGKTTVSHLLGQLWHAIEPPAAVMGTVGSGIVSQLIPEALTTPDGVTVQQRLASFVAEGARSVVMEVSSHALDQGRVEGLHFHTVIATNVSRDHLDYHGTMKAYAAAKGRLFTDFPAAVRVFNADDKIVAGWGSLDDYWYSLQPSLAGRARTLVASNIQYTHSGTRLTLNWEHESVRVESPLLGAFNVSNLLAAATAVLANKVPLSRVAELIEHLQSVPGRMETFALPNGALAIVDYAHTPDALQHVLQAARNHCSGKLWALFGCGGDRDRGKRPQMGQVAAQYADISVVTDDNPRTEAPEQIIDDIISGMPHEAEIIRQPGRAGAVQFALQSAKHGDVVVCAGKGHETYQLIGSRTEHYDERAYVAQLAEDLRHD